MIKNLIFDFGNVVIKFDPEYMTSCITGDLSEIAALSKIVFDPETFEKTDRGFVSLDQHKALVLEKVPKLLREKAARILDTWYLNLPVNDGMEELLNDAKNAGYGIYLLSNINRQFSENREKVSVLKNFDGIVLSGDVHFVKPESQIYEHLLNAFGLKSEECLFVDDRQVNIDGGEKVGIKGYLFDNAHALREFINKNPEFAYKINN